MVLVDVLEVVEALAALKAAGLQAVADWPAPGMPAAKHHGRPGVNKIELDSAKVDRG